MSGESWPLTYASAIERLESSGDGPGCGEAVGSGDGSSCGKVVGSGDGSNCGKAVSERRPERAKAAVREVQRCRSVVRPLLDLFFNLSLFSQGGVCVKPEEKLQALFSNPSRAACQGFSTISCMIGRE